MNLFYRLLIYHLDETSCYCKRILVDRSFSLKNYIYKIFLSYNSLIHYTTRRREVRVASFWKVLVESSRESSSGVLYKSCPKMRPPCHPTSTFLFTNTFSDIGRPRFRARRFRNFASFKHSSRSM